jgi:hypothetical protein
VKMKFKTNSKRDVALVFVGFILILTVTNVPFSAAAFMLIALLITSSKKCNPKHLIIFLGSFLILINITYAIPKLNEDLLLSLYLLLSIIIFWKLSGDFDIGKKRSILVFVALSVYSAAHAIANHFEKMTELVMNLVFNIGYDQVGHFAISRTLGRCGEFLYSCDPNSLNLPLNYMFYPQQWHMLFSRFINNESILLALETYLIAFIVSSLISFYLVSQSFKHFTQDIQGIGFSKYPNFLLSKNLMLACVYMLLTILSFLGYPNFVFSVALFVFAITLNDKHSRASYLLSSMCLIGSISMYTLFLVPGVLVFAYRTVFSLSPLLLKIASAFIWLLFVFSVVRIAFEKNHVDFIAIGGGGFSIVVVTSQVVLLVGFILNISQLKSKRISPANLDYELVVVNAILLFSLLSLNALLLYVGNSSGYYLAKFSYFAFIVGSINLFVTLSRMGTKIPTPPLTPMSILLMLTLAWYLVTRIPFTSPLVNLVNIATGPTASQEERILNIYSAAQASERSGKPIVVITNNSGPDTQWANSLSGNWSAKINAYLENKIDNEVEFRDPSFQARHKLDFDFYDSEKR